MIANLLRKYSSTFHPVVPFRAEHDRLLLMDFTDANTKLTAPILTDTLLFSAYVHTELQNAGALYGIGGYAENRTIYSRSPHFHTAAHEEPRRLHLGVDIWGSAGTPVFAPLGGMVHSFAFNKAYGDYGATIVLLHQLDGMAFYTLYGHLSLPDIAVLKEGQYINRGQLFAHFGTPEENGYWPPHLHLQVIENMELKEGDYPGVCKLSEREKYLTNCPDPDILLGMMQYASARHSH